MKQAVSIRLTHKGQENEFIQTFEGFFFEVSPIGYLRYAETDAQMGNTTTTIRLLPDEIRIQRRGTVESHFVFKPSERTPVTYRLAGKQMNMSAYTTRLDFQWVKHAGTITCFYELWLENERLEQIELEISVKVI